MKSSQSGRSSQTTVYPHNTRSNVGTSPSSLGWHPTINKLINRDYAFLPASYSEPGFLFRGLEVGFRSCVTNNHFGLNQGHHSLARLEKELGVLLVSADLSDAISVARFWEGSQDAGIVIIDAGKFNHEWENGSAAVLGFADPGVVFKYPFLVNNLWVSEIAYFVLHEDLHDQLANCAAESLAGITARCIVVEKKYAQSSRGELEQYLLDRFNKLLIKPAVSHNVESYPRRLPQ